MPKGFSKPKVRKSTMLSLAKDCKARIAANNKCNSLFIGYVFSVSSTRF